MFYGKQNKAAMLFADSEFSSSATVVDEDDEKREQMNPLLLSSSYSNEQCAWQYAPDDQHEHRLHLPQQKVFLAETIQLNR